MTTATTGVVPVQLDPLSATADTLDMEDMEGLSLSLPLSLPLSLSLSLSSSLSLPLSVGENHCVDKMV